MKIKTIKIKNIGMITDTALTLDKPLIVFYGEIRQGKTTILNAVRWVCGGTWPADIIRHGQKEASVELAFDGGSISRSWYVSKEGPTVAREVQFVRDGKAVKRPASEIQRLLNPFLSNQDYLRFMTETERKAYFTELFAVDTKELDIEAMNAAKAASDLRAKLTGYGVIDLTEHKPLDTTKLKADLAKLRSDHAAAVAATEASNVKVRENNANVTRGSEKLKTIATEFSNLEKRIIELNTEAKKVETWLSKHPKQTEVETPTQPKTESIEAQIADSAAQDVRAAQYQANLKRESQRLEDEKQLKALEDRQRAIKKEKAAALATVTDKCGIKDLAFDESGNFTFEGTQAGMLSTSQIMRLSSALSALYPPGLSVELCDRAESLGRAIVEYVKHAEDKKLTVLATIVGEKPANLPANVGVFVVRDGVVIPD